MQAMLTIRVTENIVSLSHAHAQHREQIKCLLAQLLHPPAAARQLHSARTARASQVENPVYWATIASRTVGDHCIGRQPRGNSEQMLSHHLLATGCELAGVKTRSQAGQLPACHLISHGASRQITLAYEGSMAVVKHVYLGFTRSFSYLRG